MAAPTFVSQNATDFKSALPKTVMNVVAITSGQVIVAVGAKEKIDGALSITEDGSSSFNELQFIDLTDYCEVRAWYYTASASETITVTGYVDFYTMFGINALLFSNTNGVGASAKANNSSGSPSVSITTTQNNSAIVVIVGDRNAVSGTQTFTSNGGAGSATSLTGFPGNAANYGVAIAYYPDAGAAGAKTVGMSAPTGQKWAIIAVEVKGTAGATGSLPPRLSNRFAHLIGR